MFPSIRELLTNLIDYAGLFPPARLPLSEAARFYAAYRESPQAWMLGRFVCGVATLAELTACPETESGFAVSGILTPPPTLADLGATLEKDLANLAAARETGRVNIETFELTLPGEVETSHWADALPRLTTACEQAKLTGFLELPYNAAWRSHVMMLATSLAGNTARLGLKVRCGGATATLVPSSADLAFFLTMCREQGVPCKATAGLHHPHRVFDHQLRVLQHGFLNVFVAAALARVHELEAASVAAILDDEHGTGFWFEETALGWNDWGVGLEDIATCRQRVATSFGSCSFDDPVQDLMRLGLIGDDKSKK